jgi:hypothetical protein
VKNKFLKLFMSHSLFVAVIFSMISFFPFQAQAASLFISSSNQSVNIGSQFTLTVKVNTSSKYINNAEGTVYYPKDLVQVVSVSKASSIFNLWITEPTNSTSSGSISFNGGVKTPGFNGSSGNIFTVTFKAKQAGTANFSFSNHAIRENDGLGTNILTGQSGATVLIKSVALPPQVVPETKLITASGLDRLVIYSDTHPDQDKWYSLDTAHFTWTNPSGVKAISTLLDTSSNSAPSTKSTLVVSEKTKPNIKDGINYFHVMYKTNAGWSKPTHYVLKIDTVAPYNLSVDYQKDSNDKYFLSLKGDDELSGIDYYTITIPGHEVFAVPAVKDSANYYFEDMMSFGENSIQIEAVDFAGNKKSITTNVNINTLEKPIITDYTKNAKVGRTIKIDGKTKYPQLETFVYIISPNGKISKYFIENINEKGEFTMFTDKTLEKGNYLAWIKIYTEDGTKSAESDSVNINVKFSLWAYILSSPLLLGSILFFIFSLIMLLLAIHLIRLHKEKVIELKKPTQV